MKCFFCKEEVDKKDGIAALIKDKDGNFQKGIILHKGNCDTIMSELVKEKDFNINSCWELISFYSEKEIVHYIKTGETPDSIKKQYK